MTPSRSMTVRIIGAIAIVAARRRSTVASASCVSRVDVMSITRPWP